jgi:hypothetical protein
MNTISDNTADEDLPKYWEGIIARLNEKTKWNLNAKNTASIDQIISKINVPKDEHPETHARTKQVWKTTMECVDRLGKFVQRFGAIIAQGASVVSYRLLLPHHAHLEPHLYGTGSDWTRSIDV